MSATSCTIDRGNKTLSVELPTTFRYTARYRIETNDPYDGHLTVFDSAQGVGPHPLPSPLDNYSFLGDIDLNAQARTFSLIQTEENNRQLWYCTVTWRPGEPGEPTQQEDLDPNPINRPSKLWIEYSRETEKVTKDINGVQILNVCKQPYPEPIIVTKSYPTLAIKRNYSALEDIWTLNDTYQYTVNSDVFAGLPAGRWQYQSTQTTESQVENQIEYWEGVTRIAYRKTGWNVEKVEEGWSHFRSPLIEELIPAVGKDGGLLGEPVRLDTNGSRLDDGLDPIVTPITIFQSVPYSGLL